MAIIYDTLYKEIPNGLFTDLLSLIPTLSAYGVDTILTPPLTQNAWGGNSVSLGYDKRYDLNVGQHPGDPLRWGTAEEGRLAFRYANAKGIQVIENNVLHQYNGAFGKTYLEKGSNSKVDYQLFPKMPSCFVPLAKRDDLFSVDGEQPYGDEPSYWNSVPTGYMINGTIQSTRLRWLWFGLNGMRIDMAKNMSVSTTKALANAAVLKNGFLVAEVYTGNPDELQRFVTLTGCPVFDFQQYFAYRDVSNGASFRRLVYSGFSDRNPSNSVKYVENNDSDGPNGIRFNKLWFYLHALTTPCKGVCIYAKDYVVYGLSKWINKYMWVSKMFAFGALNYLNVQDDFLVWSRDGNGGKYGWSGGLLCGISADPINKRSAWVGPLPFNPGDVLQDYLGNGDEIVVNKDGYVYLTIGPNVNGSASNGVAYAFHGVNRPLTVSSLPPKDYTDFMDFSSITVRYQ